MKGVQAEAQTCAYRNTSVRRLALYRIAKFLDIKIGMILVFWYAILLSMYDLLYQMFLITTASLEMARFSSSYGILIVYF